MANLCFFATRFLYDDTNILLKWFCVANMITALLWHIYDIRCYCKESSGFPMILGTYLISVVFNSTSLIFLTLFANRDKFGSENKWVWKDQCGALIYSAWASILIFIIGFRQHKPSCRLNRRCCGMQFNVFWWALLFSHYSSLVYILIQYLYVFGNQAEEYLALLMIGVTSSVLAVHEFRYMKNARPRNSHQIHSLIAFTFPISCFYFLFKKCFKRKDDYGEPVRYPTQTDNDFSLT